MNCRERLSSYVPPGDTEVRVISVVRVFQLVHKAVYSKTRYCYQPPLLPALCLGRVLKMASNDSGEPRMMWSPAAGSSRPVTGRYFPSIYKPQNTHACDTRRRAHCCTVCNTLLLVWKTVLFVNLYVGLTLSSFLPRSTGSGISTCPETLFYCPLPLRTMTFPPSHNPGCPFLELPLHMHSKIQILFYVFWFVTRFLAFKGLFIFNINFWYPDASNTVSGARQHSTDGFAPSSLLPPPSAPPFLPSSPSFPLSFPLFPSSLALINQDEK